MIHKGWTAVTGPNGSGKTTLIKLIGGMLSPSSGSISAPGSFYYCEQKTDDIPPNFKQLLESYEPVSFKLKLSLGIKDEWINRWDTLSQGERKRSQIASALFFNPDILAVDEPSNHLDFESKEFLFNALKFYKGIGLLVSHDRKLLNDLCRNTIFIYNHKIDFRRTGYSAAAEERERENQLLSAQFDSLNSEIKKLKVKAVNQKQKADMADKEFSKRKIPRKDRNAKAKIDLGRLTGRDATAGRLYRKTKNEIERKSDLLHSIDVNRTFEHGIEFNNTKMNRWFPLVIPSFKIDLDKKRRLYVPDLIISAEDKIGITGKNGSGKTTFVRRLVEQLRFPGEDVIYIPQEIENRSINKLMKRIKELKNVQKGKIMTIISRLNSDPKHLLETDEPSPGEVRKLLLAEGISHNPALIIMDEPTNHMDLPSIECIEKALNECRCPVLLVSHDSVFLQNVVSSYWNFTEDKNGFFIELL
jgi:ATPase subunit of ABC transporter with duplicated ATPase domains